MSHCTYLGCTSIATVPQIAKDGQQWANLCVEHDAQLNEDIESGNARKLLSDWVKAQGGAKKAAARI